MQLTLKGKIKKLSNTYGIIKSNDYEEEHFFMKSDIIQNDRSKIKVGSTVAFELKVNKARGSNAHKIKLLNDKNIIYDDVSKLKSSPEIETLFTSSKIHVSYKAFQEFITEGFHKLDNQDKDLNDLIKLVVSDNVITDIEKNFLKEKTLELNLSTDLTKKAVEYLFSNNPFFDNILAIIFKDGLIKENELAFLFEKSKEHNFSESFINKRFWQYYFKLHFNNLLEVKNIQKIIKLWHLSKFLEFDLAMNNDWIIMQLNIRKSLKLENNISRALNEFERIIFPLIEERYSLSSIDKERLYDCLSLDNDKKANNSPILEYNKNNPFKSNNKYTKEDIYKFFSVPKEQQKGKWHNGYCEHNNDWFIFTNIGQAGYGFNQDNEFDYNNTLDQFGDLNWEAINNSKLSWDSIQKLKSSTPYIFIRKPDTEKNYWEYLGIGHCLFTLDTTPVKFKWKILLEKTPIKEKKTINKISNSKNEKTLKQWNKNIVSEKHKSRIITLINNDEIFDASQEYLNFAYENNQKDFSKIMDEFEKITENLRK